jgi:hypothetical protein
MYYAAGAVESVWRTHVGKVPVMTSARDGKHSETSLHYKGLAFDLRTRDMTLAKAKEMWTLLRLLLEPRGFDVVDEIETKSHIHIEYQPKNDSERIFTRES